MNKPYYQEDGITIYHGDCRAILPHLSKVDLVLTDPPYGLNEDGGRKRTRGKTGTDFDVRFEKGNWDNETPGKEVFDAISALSEYQVYWGGNYFADKLPVSRGWFYWHKFMGGDFADGELAWTNRDAVLKTFGYSNAKNRAHGTSYPTQKPLDLMIWCLSFFPEAKIILDPFMGSGTTLVAARNLGLTAIGIDRNLAACEIAVGRFAQSVIKFSIPIFEPQPLSLED